MNIEVSVHAKERFVNRYPNLKLSDNFVDYIINNSLEQTAINRKGHLVRNKNRGIFRSIYNGQNIEFVLSKQKNGKYVIVTFNTPPRNIYDVCWSYNKEEE